MQAKKKTARRSLVVSAVALFLSVAMLVGTTFAWFTDTVTSGTNTITAGNLDIEVSYKNAANGSWTPMEGDRSLFSNNLWEPGHTEFVTLKIENKGTLALNYKVLVTPVSENGGVNVAGNSFKLSDYLVVKTIKGTDDPNYQSREAARSAAGETRGLTDVGKLTQTGTMNGKTDDVIDTQYVTLVVYMPETIENEANYKTGTEPPTIDLGIKVLATQKTAENDSFGSDYDGGAVSDSFYTAGAYYNFFEAVNETVTATSGTFSIEKRNSSNTGVIASVSGTADEDARVSLVIAKTSMPQGNFGITVGNGEELNGYEIKVTGQTAGSLVQGKLYVGTGLENFKFYHSGEEMTKKESGNLENNEYRYDSNDGYVYFASITFSPFQATYKAPAAAITNGNGTAVYGTLADAVNASKSGDTIVMLKDETVEGNITVNGGKDITLDLNGHDVVSNDYYVFDVSNAKFHITGNGSIFENVKDGYAPIIAKGSDTDVADYTVITIDKGVTLKGDYTGIFVGKDVNEGYNNYGLVVNMKGIIDMSAVAEGYHYSGLYVNGQNTQTTGNVMQFNLDGVTVTGCKSEGIYAAGYAKWNITNCNITGVDSAIEIRAGELNINGGNYTATGDRFSSNSNGNGSTTSGAAIAIAQHTTKLPIRVNIKDGTFNGVKALAQTNPEGNSNEDVAKISVSVSGGTFSSDPSAYVAKGYTSKQLGGVYKIYEGDLAIATAEDLFAFAKEVNVGNNNFRGKKVILISDIDLQNQTWTPIGNLVSYPSVTFSGTFDGQGHTISNMNVADRTVNHAVAGFFGSTAGATITNVTFKNAVVNSTHYAGVVVAYEGANNSLTNISNVVVDGATIVSSAELIDTKWDNGDKVGGIAGYATSLNIQNCAVKDTQIGGYRDLGGIIGCADGNFYSSVTNCSVDNVTITIDKTNNYKNYSSQEQHNANNYIGRNQNSAIDSGNTGSVTIVY